MVTRLNWGIRDEAVMQSLLFVVWPGGSTNFLGGMPDRKVVRPSWQEEKTC
jgi:hypothetical protein